MMRVLPFKGRGERRPAERESGGAWKARGDVSLKPTTEDLIPDTYRGKKMKENACLKANTENLIPDT